MNTLVSVLPELVNELSALLEAAERPEISMQLSAAEMTRCSYDEEADAGYIGLSVPPMSLHFANLASPVAETVSFYAEHGINLDVTHDGDLLGIEFLGRGDVVSRLKEAHAI